MLLKHIFQEGVTSVVVEEPHVQFREPSVTESVTEESIPSTAVITAEESESQGKSETQTEIRESEDPAKIREDVPKRISVEEEVS